MSDRTPQEQAEIRERLQALRESAGTLEAATEEPDRRPPAASLDLPLVKAGLQGVRIGVGQAPDGTKLLVIGPFALELHVPLPQDVAGEIGATLTGGVHVPGLEVDLASLGADRAAIADAARTVLEREGRAPRRPR